MYNTDVNIVWNAATVIWNELEKGWECSKCGALYSDKEVARYFCYCEPLPCNFQNGYCADCGCYFENCKIDT